MKESAKKVAISSREEDENVKKKQKNLHKRTDTKVSLMINTEESKDNNSQASESQNVTFGNNEISIVEVNIFIFRFNLIIEVTFI